MATTASQMWAERSWKSKRTNETRKKRGRNDTCVTDGMLLNLNSHTPTDVQTILLSEALGGGMQEWRGGFYGRAMDSTSAFQLDAG